MSTPKDLITTMRKDLTLNMHLDADQLLEVTMLCRQEGYCPCGVPLYRDDKRFMLAETLSEHAENPGLLTVRVFCMDCGMAIQQAVKDRRKKHGLC